jgi:hypothetical protein
MQCDAVSRLKLMINAMVCHGLHLDNPGKEKGPNDQESRVLTVPPGAIQYYPY